MGTKDYDFIRCEPHLFSYTFERPLEVDPDDRFQRGLEVVAEILSAFDHLIRPTSVEYGIADESGDETYERTLTDDGGLSAETITADMRRIASEKAETPHLTVFRLTERVRIALSEGVKYIGAPSDSSVFRDGKSTEVTAPLTVELRHRSVMKPSHTEELTVIGHSDHWIDDSESDTPGSGSLKKLNQSRLVAAVSHLYDAIEPLEVAFDTYEDRDGRTVPWRTVPGFELLHERRCIEWVLDNFDRTWTGDEKLILRYRTEQLDPLVQSPDGMVETYLRTAFPNDRFDPGTTVVVRYPGDTATLHINPDGSWSFDSRSDL